MKLRDWAKVTEFVWTELRNEYEMNDWRHSKRRWYIDESSSWVPTSLYLRWMNVLQRLTNTTTSVMARRSWRHQSFIDISHRWVIHFTKRCKKVPRGRLFRQSVSIATLTQKCDSDQVFNKNGFSFHAHPFLIPNNNEKSAFWAQIFHSANPQ